MKHTIFRVSKIGICRWIKKHKRPQLSVQFNFPSKRYRNGAGGLSTRTGEITGTERDERFNWDLRDALGWVSDDVEPERSKPVIQRVKDGLIEHSNIEMEKTAVLHYFLFDDHEEYS